MIIVVSDVHLGYQESNTASFKNFVYDYVSKKLGPKDHLVLLGDIFDFWRRKNMDPLLENENVLTKILSMDTNVHYVVGNHDYYMLRIKERFPDYSALELGKYLRLKDGKSKFFFMHGYELDVLANYEPLTLEECEKISEALCRAENILGRIMSMLWGLKKKLKKSPEERKSWKKEKESGKSHIDNLEKFARSKVRNFFLGLEYDEKLVFGHTHKPFVDKDTANTGSWVKNGHEYNTFIEIENGKMKLKNKNLDNDFYKALYLILSESRYSIRLKRNIITHRKLNEIIRDIQQQSFTQQELIDYLDKSKVLTRRSRQNYEISSTFDEISKKIHDGTLR